MESVSAVVIGAGHAGLAMSHELTARGVEHVVIERGRLAERWRSGRWESFRLLTPSWLARLPGYRYTGPDPDGFMAAPELVDYLTTYARSFGAPVRERTTVTEVRQAPGGYLVHTDRGDWRAAHVVIATGYYATALRPAGTGRLSPELAQFTASGYRAPSQLPPGGVLVVGASASGLQIAGELNRAGRAVTLAVGRHNRLPRRYRGQDILWWLERTGALDRTVDDLAAAGQDRYEPSMQLVGGQERLDLAVLQERGVRLTGRLRAVERHTAAFAADLPATTAEADERLRRLLARIDRYVASAYPGGAGGPVPPPAGPVPPLRPAPGPDRMHLRRAGITSVIWATGFRPWYPWLRVPVLDPAGRLRHRRGVTDAAGLYAIGLRFQYRRSSTFIDGARHDAAYLRDQICARGPRNGVHYEPPIRSVRR